MKTIAHNLLLFAALALPALCAAQPKPTDDPQRNLQKFDNFYRWSRTRSAKCFCNWTLTRPTYRPRKWLR